MANYHENALKQSQKAKFSILRLSPTSGGVPVARPIILR
jgi:hypothetical protein